jgi:hypothetical protein
MIGSSNPQKLEVTLRQPDSPLQSLIGSRGGCGDWFNP